MRIVVARNECSGPQNLYIAICTGHKHLILYLKIQSTQFHFPPVSLGMAIFRTYTSSRVFVYRSQQPFYPRRHDEHTNLSGDVFERASV